MNIEPEIVEAEILDEPPEPEFEPGPIGARFGALCLDVILVTAVFTLLLTQYILPEFYPGAMDELMEHFTNPDEDSSFSSGMSDYLTKALTTANGISFFFIFLYFTLAPVLLKGGTLGMKIFNLRIQQRDSAEPAPLSAHFVRAAIKTVCLQVLFPLLTLLFLYAFRSSERIAVHDLAARTRVVRAPAFTTK
tara:strand:- start:19503 stop:20078 length:576 start_codon:yes stop_codon:yes gene_type:complete